MANINTAEDLSRAVLYGDSAEYLVKRLVQRVKEADKFAYSEILDIINAKHKQAEVTLLASGWGDTYPYTQEVALDDISGNENIRVLGIVHPDGATAAQDKAINKAAGQLISNDTGVAAGKLIFKALKKPTVDFTVVIEGYDVTTAMLSDTATYGDVAELTWGDLEGKVWYQIKVDDNGNLASASN